MFGNSGIGLADIAAVTGGRNNDNDGLGGNGGIWVLIILFAIFGGWGNGGFGGGNGATQGALTRGDLCMDMNFNDLQNAVRGISADLQAGFRTIDNAVCTLGYNNAQLANGIQMQIANEFRGLDNAVCTLGYQTQAGFNSLAQQQAQCCCEQKAEAAQTRFEMERGFCNLGNQLANATRDIIDNQNAQYLRQVEAENQALRMQAYNANLYNDLVQRLDPCPEPAYITCNPRASYYGNGNCGNCGNWNNGCCN